MVLHVYVFLLVVCLFLSLALLWRLDWFPLRPSCSKGAAKRSRLPRLLKPRCPDDCPACRLTCTPSSGGEPAPLTVRPWREMKSRRGAPKRVKTEGFACPNRQCAYFGNTDAHIHALGGDGKHGLAEQIQTFRCQACHTTFTARRNTPLYRLKTPSHQVAVVLSALAEGLDPSAAERVFGYRQATITSLSVPCWGARAYPARALLPQPAPPASPIGRTAHQVAQRQAGSVALAGHRSLHQASSRALSGAAYTRHGTPAHPLAATDAGRLSASHSLPVMASISTFMPSRPILDTGLQEVVTGG
jgi:hypothetical protein